MFLLYFFKKSDNSLKNAILKTIKIGLCGRLGLYSKKALQSVLFKKWCRWQACAPAGTRRSRKASLRSLSLAELRPARSPHLLRNSVLSKVTIKKPSVKEGFLMVPLARIGLATPSLPMTCSTTELQRQNIRLCRSRGNIQNHFSKCKHIFLIYKLFL